MTRRVSLRVRAFAGAALWILAAAAVQAQTEGEPGAPAQPAAPAPPAPAPKPPSGLEELTVTAQKREESVQEIPVAVTAVTGEELEAFSISDTVELTTIVPNIQVNQINGDGMPVFSIRGITMNDYSIHQSGPVATYVDEVYAGPPILQGIHLFDIERVEVLRGPQGTLYGRNTTGGAVNLITRAPGFETEGYLTAGLGNYSRYEAQGAFQTALVPEVLAMRLAGTWTQQDGWFENEAPGEEDMNAVDEWGVRLSLLFTPNEDLDVILRLSAGESNPVNYGIYTDNTDQFDDPANGVGIGVGVYSLFHSLGGANPPDYSRRGLGRWELESNHVVDRKREVQQVSLHVDWDFTEELTLTSITSYTHGDALNPEDTDGSPLALFEIDYFGDGDQWAQDLRVSSNYEGPFNFLAGVYWGREDLDVGTDLGFYHGLDTNLNGRLDMNDCLDPLTVAGGGTPSPAGQAAELALAPFGLSLGDLAGAGCRFENGFQQVRSTLAGYLDGSYEVVEGLTVRAGVRWTQDETELRDFTDFIKAAGVPVANVIPGDPVNVFATLDDRDFTDRELTGRLGLEYLTEGGLLVYVMGSRGYRSGAFNGQAFFDPSEVTQVDPEYITGAELGVKAEIGERVRINSALFYYDYENQQLIDVNPATGVQTLINIDQSTIIGVEVELLAQITEDLTATVDLGWLDAEVDEGVVSGVDIEGDTPPNAPDWSLNLGLTWDFLQLEAGSFTLYTNASYVDDMFFTLPNVRRTSQRPYWLVNGRIAFESEAGFGVAVWGKNLTREWYKTSSVPLDAIVGGDYTHIGAPRTFGVEFSYRF